MAAESFGVARQVSVLSLLEKQRLAYSYSEYEQLAARAAEVFGSEVDATKWLSSNSPDFAGKTPLQELVEQGSSHAMEVLGKIEHGVFF